MGSKRRDSLNATSETQILWMALLVIDTFFTFLGVLVRDVGDKGFCARDGSIASDVNVTDVNVNARNARAAMYSLAIIVFLIIAWGAAPPVLFLKAYCTKGGDYKEVFENVFKNFVIGISGALYLAGDNLFILIDANKFTSSGIPAHEVQSYLLGAAIVFGAAVYLIPKVFDVHYESEDDVEGGGMELQKNYLGLSLKWAKFTLLAPVLDCLFTIIVNGVEETATGCPSLETTRSDVGFYFFLIAACVVVFTVFGISSCFRCKKLLSNDGRNLGGCCGVTLLAIVTSIFIPLYIAFNNDYPWFCFAENDDGLCAWVALHSLFLVITLALSITIFVVGIVVWAFAIYRRGHRSSSNHSTEELEANIIHPTE